MTELCNKKLCIGQRKQNYFNTSFLQLDFRREFSKLML
jgi:hypothetical protein